MTVLEEAQEKAQAVVSDTELAPARSDASSFVLKAGVGAWVAAVGFAFYFSGWAYHLTYLNHFSIPEGIFAKDHSSYLTDAGVALATQAVTASVSLMKHIATFILTSLAYIVFWSGMACLIVRFERNGITFLAYVRPRIARHKIFGRVASIAAMPIGLTIAALCLMLLLPISTMLFLLGAYYLGAGAANEAYQHDITAYQRPCGQAQGETRCVLLRKDGRTLATGYVIESSPQRVAIFENGNVTVFPTKDTEIAAFTATFAGHDRARDTSR